jgi:hypothetical protein
MAPPCDDSKSRAPRLANGPDRRRVVRVPLPGHLQYVHEGEVRRESVVDISEGGLRLQLFEPPPVRARLKLFLPLPRSDRGASSLCFLEGEVVWQSEDGAGIAFSDPSAESLSRVRSFVRHSA